MIARLEGVLREQQPTRVVVDVGGVGYEVHIPLSTFTELPTPGKTVALQIHTHAKDGAIQLFGFFSEAERVAFELLLRANRVGPRLAQTILSGITPAVLLDAIRNGSAAVLRAVPGVGTKVAERCKVCALPAPLAPAVETWIPLSRPSKWSSLEFAATVRSRKGSGMFS